MKGLQKAKEVLPKAGLRNRLEAGTLRVNATAIVFAPSGAFRPCRAPRGSGPELHGSTFAWAGICTR